MRIKCKSESKGSHEVLINEIGKYIKGFSFSDYRIFNANIGQLKELRVNADYKDELFDKTKSYNSIALSNKIILILKRY